MFDWLTAWGRARAVQPGTEALARALFDDLDRVAAREWPGLGVLRAKVHPGTPGLRPTCVLPVFLPSEPLRQSLNPGLPARADRHGDLSWLHRVGWDEAAARQCTTRVLQVLLGGDAPLVDGLGRLHLEPRASFRGRDGAVVPAGHTIEVAFAPEAILAANPDPVAASYAMMLTVAAAARRGTGTELYREWAHLAQPLPVPRPAHDAR
jgi:hypothetical protein